MRALLFVACFSIGVTLMVLSGYMPRQAAAVDVSKLRRSVGDGPGRPASVVDLTDGQARWATTRSLPGDPDPADTEIGAPEVASSERHAEPIEPVAAAPNDTSTAEAGQTEEREPDEIAPDETATPTEPSVVAGESDYREGARRDSEADPSAEPPPPAVEPSPAPDEPLAPDAPPPVADAGPDRVLWNGWKDFGLDGSASHGDGLTYEWRQLSGPSSITFVDAAAATTRAAGLRVGEHAGWTPTLYEFELTVTDVEGRSASDVVEMVVLAAPELTVRPPATRRFEQRDGYWLGHYDSKAEADGADAVMFEVSSPTQLAFTRVTGPETQVVSVALGDTNAYELTVVRTAGQPAEVVELLVDSDERIPGILRLHVQWEVP